MWFKRQPIKKATTQGEGGLSSIQSSNGDLAVDRLSALPTSNSNDNRQAQREGRQSLTLASAVANTSNDLFFVDKDNKKTSH